MCDAQLNTNYQFKPEPEHSIVFCQLLVNRERVTADGLQVLTESIEQRCITTHKHFLTCIMFTHVLRKKVIQCANLSK